MSGICSLTQTSSFYEWRSPPATRALLCKLFAVWLLITVTPTYLLVQMSFLVLGVVFFVLTPIGHHYFQYQLLTSPLMWMLWGIPTHADWAIARLQAEAEPVVQTDGNSGKGNREEADGEATRVSLIGRYACEGGVLRITTQSACYVRISWLAGCPHV
jgi:hypothetical protein